VTGSASFAEAWLRDWNSRDLDVILRHYAEDVVFRSPKVALFTGGETDTLRGREALRPYFTRGLAGRPNLKFEPMFTAEDLSGVALVYRGDDGSTAVETMSLNAAGEVAEARVFYHTPAS
jgi:hypothetical protein